MDSTKRKYCYGGVEVSKEVRNLICADATELLARRGCLCGVNLQCQQHRALAELKEPRNSDAP
jgi:hypothetical protein